MYLIDMKRPGLIEAKDNALNTALMNAVVSCNDSVFIYLYFKFRCDTNTLDYNGNTLLHLAAQSNSMNIARLLRHLYNTDLKQDYIKTIEGQNDIEMSDIKSKEIIPTIEEFEHSRIETNKKLNDNIDVFDIMSDRASSRDTMVLPPNSYFDVTRMNMHGQTPLFIAVCNQSTDMFEFLLECQSDITQKELQHGESVRDCVFRYCQITEEYNSPLSLLSDDTDSIV